MLSIFKTSGLVLLFVLFTQVGITAQCPPLYTYEGIAYDELGASVSGVGDFNGDGYDDIIAGAPGVQNEAYVYSGLDGTLLCELQSEGGGDDFGGSVSGAGDVNHDGFADVIVGAFRNDAGGTDAGRAYIFFGGNGPYPRTINAANADMILTGETSHDLFGIAVAGVGDVDGDGFGDVMVGASESNAGAYKAGRVYVFLGSAGPYPVNITAGSAHQILTGDDAEARFGGSIAGIGDIDLDGCDDFVIGEEGDDAGGLNAGAAHVISGRTGSLLYKFNGEYPNDRHGIGVSGAGDINDDGWPDIVVGSDLYNGWTGKAYVYSGKDGTLLIDITGEATGDRFGHFVSTAGDMNGDGFGDLLLSAYINDAGGHYAGRAYVVLGDNGIYPKSINASAADFIFTGEAPDDRLGVSIASAGDLNNDGTDEIIVGAVDENHVGSSVYVFDCVEGEPGSDTTILAFDIKPGSCPNPLNINGGGPNHLWLDDEESGEGEITYTGYARPNHYGPVLKGPVIPAAILGTDDLDVNLIDPTTIALNGVLPVRWSYYDVATPVAEDATDCECNDLGPDGLDDLLLKFNKQAIINALGDVMDGDIVTLTISGQFYDGTFFEGSDCVLIIDRGHLDGSVVQISNYPNPFNPSTTISFSLAQESDVELSVFNITGQRVKTLLNGMRETGEHSVIWDGRDESGQTVSSGIYFYRIKTDEFSKTRKMLMMK